ncbi:MAG: hypothetical protein K0R50_2097 [Eubacterium sp.]|nr:hypothetical protein [Eubacterium sp.]
MKAFFYTILSSILYILVLLFGVKPACIWWFYQPRVPKLK